MPVLANSSAQVRRYGLRSITGLAQTTGFTLPSSFVNILLGDGARNFAYPVYHQLWQDTFPLAFIGTCEACSTCLACIATQVLVGKALRWCFIRAVALFAFWTICARPGRNVFRYIAFHSCAFVFARVTSFTCLARFVVMPVLANSSAQVRRY